MELHIAIAWEQGCARTCAALLCLVVCLYDLAFFFLPSFSSLIKTYVHVYMYVYTCSKIYSKQNYYDTGYVVPSSHSLDVTRADQSDRSQHSGDEEVDPVPLTTPTDQQTTPPDKQTTPTVQQTTPPVPRIHNKKFRE